MSEDGQVLITRLTDPETLQERLIVDRADPVAWFAAELLEEISVLTARNEDRWSSLDPLDDHRQVLTIKADNRTVVYVIDYREHDWERACYLGRWPD